MAGAGSWGDSPLSGQLESRELVAEDKPAMKALCNECFPVEYPDVWYDGLVSGAEEMFTRGTFEKSTGLLVGMIASQIQPLRLVEREYGAIVERARRNDTVMYINIFGKKSVGILMFFDVAVIPRANFGLSFVCACFLWNVAVTR